MVAHPHKSIVQLPAPATHFNATPRSLLADTRRILKAARALQDALSTQITPETATVANTLLPLMHEENERLCERQLIEFYSSVSPSEEVRDASHEAERLFCQFDNETALRDDLYALVVAVRERGEKNVSAESERFLHQAIRHFEQNGLALPGKGRERLKEIDASLSRLKREYLKVCADVVDSLWFTEDELEGLSGGLLEDLHSGSGTHEGRLELRLEGNRYHEAMACVRKEETRRKIYTGRADKCRRNVALLERAIPLRQEKAELLGYDSFAELRMATMMEKSPRTIESFLDDLLARLTPARDERTARWRRLKREDLAARHERDDASFYAWDCAYYSNKSHEEMHPDEDDHDKEYFALDETITRMLLLVEQVFSIDLAEVSFEQDEGSPMRSNRDSLVWHEEVRMFAVWDNSKNDGRRDGLLGYLYMDMYPRKGKIPGFCDLPIRPAFINSDGHRQHTSTCLVCNFDRPTETKPSLLEHSQVVLLFHELGHAIHDLVARTDLARFHGASTAGDFNEAPSQMLEQWCWYAPTLRMLSQHYSNLSPEYMQRWRKGRGYSGECDQSETLGALPEDRIQKLVEEKKTYNIGRCLVILDMAHFDLAIHSCTSQEEAEAMDTTGLYHSINSRIFGLDMPFERPPMHAASTDHFDDSGSYVYLTSQVYASDMFHCAFKDDPMNRNRGLLYRNTVIGKGSSADEMKMLVEFLGRPPQPDALYEELGLSFSGTA